jgi:hypothetical protein
MRGGPNPRPGRLCRKNAADREAGTATPNAFHAERASVPRQCMAVTIPSSRCIHRAVFISISTVERIVARAESSLSMRHLSIPMPSQSRQQRHGDIEQDKAENHPSHFVVISE